MPNDQELQQLADDMVRQCMEDPDALSCAIEMIEAIPDDLVSCRPELLFFTREDCSVCDEDRDKYRSLIQQGTVREVKSDSQEGHDIMTRNSLKFTPSLALIDCKGKLIGEFFDSNVVQGDVIDTAPN